MNINNNRVDYIDGSLGCFNSHHTGTDLDELTEQTHYYLLLFKVMGLQDRVNEATECLEFSRDIQIRYTPPPYATLALLSML